MKSLSRVQLSATPWAVAYQAPWSMGFSRQEYWSGLPFPSPGDLPNPGIEPGSPTLYADALPSELPGKSLVKKNPPANAGDLRDVGLSREDPLEEAMATHSSILAWRIPRTEEPGRLWSMGSQRIGQVSIDA